MKYIITASNTFKSADNEQLKKNVTDKIQKLINEKIRKAI